MGGWIEAYSGFHSTCRRFLSERVQFRMVLEHAYIKVKVKVRHAELTQADRSQIAAKFNNRRICSRVLVLVARFSILGLNLHRACSTICGSAKSGMQILIPAPCCKLKDIFGSSQHPWSLRYNFRSGPARECVEESSWQIC